MARSEYVYIAQRFENAVAGFTVKRELVAWLAGQSRMDWGLHGVRVVRVKDGGREPLQNTALDLTELLEGE